ncbi:MAG: hypothetical protein E3J96_03105 [Sulfurovum sp.]|nr:MAG: hypothetical protein E3J96_03105 [Sulfurovum sp.]
MFKLAKIIILFTLLLLSNILLAKGVPAGTQIVNVAELTYKVGTSDFNTTSNTLVDVVDQVLDLEIICQDSNPVIVQSGKSQRALTFRVSNIGNGTDKFALTQETNSTSDFTVNNPSIYIDTNANGVFDTAVDQQINDINLTADTNATLFFVSDMPSGNFASGSQSANGIEARSTISGSGIPGTAIDLGSYFAVDGIRGGVDSDLCVYELSTVNVVLDKSATLSSDKLFTGTIIHYKIEVKVEGSGSVDNVVVKDTIPTGTSYVTNSIKLDSVSLSDNGHISGTFIMVPVGNMTQSDVHTVEFDVKVY